MRIATSVPLMAASEFGANIATCTRPATPRFCVSVHPAATSSAGSDTDETCINAGSNTRSKFADWRLVTLERVTGRPDTGEADGSMLIGWPAARAKSATDMTVAAGVPTVNVVTKSAPELPTNCSPVPLRMPVAPPLTVS